MGQSKLRRKATRRGPRSADPKGRRGVDPAAVLNDFLEYAYAGGGVYPIGSIDIRAEFPDAPPSGPVYCGTVRLFHIFGHIDAIDHPLADTLLLVDFDGYPQLAVPGMALVAGMQQAPEKFGAEGQATLEGAETILARHREQDTACPICHVSPSRSVH